MLNSVITKQEPPELYHQPVCHGHAATMCKEPYHHYVAQEQHILLPYAR